MTKPTLSIIIPAYNCENHISHMVQSIQASSFPDWELIIVNDKSTDSTKTVVANLTKSDRRITLVNQRQNGGASVARNTGIGKARGQYVMFLDADDELKPHALATFIKAIEQPQVDLAVSGFTIQAFRSGHRLSSVNTCLNKLPDQGRDESWRLYILRLLGLDGRLYQVWNKIYRADIIHQHQLTFPVGINFGEDLLFNLSYYAHMTGRIKFIHQPLYIYKQNLDSGTFSKSSLIYANRQQNYRAVLDFMSTEPDSPTKASLLSWLKYNWIYSHLLAISSSRLPRTQKLASIREIVTSDGNTPFSDPVIIGSRRVKVEKLLHYLINHPRLAISVIGLSNRVKNSRLFAGVWQSARRRLNN